MFAKCESLVEINILNFSSKNADIDSMFEGCKSIKTVITKNSKIIIELNKKK